MPGFTIPNLCIVPPSFPADTWYIVGIGCAVLLFAETPTLFLLLRGVQSLRLRLVLASVPLLVGIWSLFLAVWVWVDPRTFIFKCSLGAPGEPPGGLIETSPPIVRAQSVLEIVTDILVSLILVGGLSLAIRLRERRVALRASQAASS
jgi:hypothetical protein